MKNTKISNGVGGGGNRGGQVRFAPDTLDERDHHLLTSPPSPPPPSSPPPPPHHHLSSSASSSSSPTSSSTPSSSVNKPTTPKYSSKDLHGNMTRVQIDRDPLFYYEVVSIMGVGSMGSVAKVRKRDSVIGGSARKSIQQHFEREKKLKTCFQIPIIGSVFEYCMKLTGQDQDEFTRSQRSGGSQDSSSSNNNNNNNKNSSSDSEWGCIPMMNSSRSLNSSILQTRTNIVEDYNDGHGEPGNNNNKNSSGSGIGSDSGSGSSREKGIFYAMKSIHLSRVTDPTFIDELKNEIQILKTLDHPHVVKAMETFEHRNQIFIVMELAYGGDLYSRDPYTEEEAARITTSILSAVSYIHSMNIIHRDLKYENILFINNSPKAEIKLIDFGLSAKFGNENLTEGVGTIYTMAPEVLKGKYTKQADVWSVGVIAYMLLSSQMPFYGRKRRHIVEQIMKGEFQFKGRRWKRVSAQSREFIRDLLVVDPEERLDAESALSASWLNKRFSATVRNPFEEELEAAKQSILKFKNYNKLKRVALMVIAHKSTSDEIGILRKIFEKYDTTRDGHLDHDEFQAAIADCGFSREHALEIFDAVDLDGTGKIKYTEFLAATIEARGAISEERLAEAFDRIDADDSGFISAENLKELLGNDFPPEEIDAIINSADTITRDGKVSYLEFLSLWEEKSEEIRRQSIQDITMLLHNDSNSGLSSCLSDDISDVSTVDAGDDALDDYAARGNFLKQKINSQRISTEEPVGVGGKHVLFQESVQTIPTTFYHASTDDVEKAAPLIHAAAEATAPSTQSASVASRPLPAKLPAVATV